MAVTTYPNKGETFTNHVADEDDPIPLEECAEITVLETVDGFAFNSTMDAETHAVRVEWDDGGYGTVMLEDFGSLWTKKSELEIMAEQDIKKGDLIETSLGPLEVCAVVESQGLYSCGETEESERVYGRRDIYASDIESADGGVVELSERR